jgi:hypothetical protein
VATAGAEHTSRKPFIYTALVIYMLASVEATTEVSGNNSILANGTDNANKIIAYIGSI